MDISSDTNERRTKAVKKIIRSKIFSKLDENDYIKSSNWAR